MKITSAHYEHMKDAIAPVLAAHPDAWAKYQADGLSATRFNFDVMYAAKLNSFICSEVYKYANDEHIKTALQKITGVR